MTYRLPMYALLQQLGGYLRCPAGQMPSAVKCMCSATLRVSVECCEYPQLVCSIKRTCPRQLQLHFTHAAHCSWCEALQRCIHAKPDSHNGRIARASDCGAHPAGGRACKAAGLERFWQLRHPVHPEVLLRGGQVGPQPGQGSLWVIVSATYVQQHWAGLLRLCLHWRTVTFRMLC